MAGDRSVIWAGVVCAVPAPPGSAPGRGDRGDGEERDHAGGKTHPHEIGQVRLGPIPRSRSSSIASGDLSSSSPIPRAISGAFVNWICRYSTTWKWLPHGSRKSRPRPGRMRAPASSSERRAAVEIVDDEADVPVGVGLLGAAGRQRDELVAHVDEGHAPSAAAQREVEDPSVELERLVDVGDLHRYVVHTDSRARLDIARRR